MLPSACPKCGASWETVEPEGYGCKACDRTFTREELAEVVVSKERRRGAERKATRQQPFPIPEWTSFPIPPDRVRSVFHVLSSFFHETNEEHERIILEEVRDELMNYLHELGFFENDGADETPPYEFVSEYGVAGVLAGLKFSLWQRDINSPGAYLRNLVEGGGTGQLHPYIRTRLLGYVERFDRWLCPEEARLLVGWAEGSKNGLPSAAVRATIRPTPGQGGR